MKKRYTEEQIIGFLREADAGLPITELCRRHGFSEASFYLWRMNRPQFSRHFRASRNTVFQIPLGNADRCIRVDVLNCRTSRCNQNYPA